jgi:TolA-binding protein
MKDPERLSETGGDPGAQMLRAARRYRVSDETRQRALAAAGLVAGGTVAAGSKAAAAGIALKLRWWVIAGLVGLSAGGYFVLGRPARAPSAPAAVVSASAQVEQLPASSQTAVATPSLSASAAPARATSSSGPRPAPRRAPGDLQAELAALDGASKALHQGDAPGALALLDAYGRDFPRGSLAMEATVLRAEALEAAGRHEEAVALARAFVRDHPKSPLVDRMRQIAGD